MLRTVFNRILDAPLLSGWMALFGGIIAVGIPTSVRAAISGVVTGCEFTPYLPFVLLSAIILGWRAALLVTLASVGVLGGLFEGPTNHLVTEACFLSSAGIFLTSSALIIGTVVPRALHNLEVLSEKYFRKTPVIAGQGAAEWPLQLDVDEPHNVGADRALNAIAAHAKYPGDLLVIDFGTATTFDVVGASGAYTGGIIAPGINLSLDALVNAAAKLPRIAIEAPETDSVIGRTTASQMIIGIYWGYVAMLEGLTERIKKEVGGPVTVVATGGLATLFDKHTNVFDAIEPDLTVQGLSLLYDMATRKQ